MFMHASIIIVNWNTGQLLHKCVESIYKLDGKYSFEIIIVDNASKDESMNIVIKEYSNITYIKNKINLGFAAANNQAIKVAKGKYILLLNPDTEFTDNANLTIMLDYMMTNSTVGISGCKLMYQDGRWQKSIGHFSTILSGLAEQTGFNHIMHRNKILRKTGNILAPIFKNNLSHFNERKHLSHLPIDVDFIWGAYFLINKNVINQIGLLDETFFIFGEESDYCFRAKKYGWKVQYVPYTSIIHISGQSQKNNITQMYYWHIAIYFWFFRKHFPIKLFIWLPLTFIIQGVLYLNSMFRRNSVTGFIHYQIMNLCITNINNYPLIIHEKWKSIYTNS